MLLFLLVVVLVPRFFIFCFILLRAHVGYWQFLSALFRCFSSLYNSCVLEQMVFALCCSVPITLYFDVKGWWLSHCRYRSVWVGFLYTDGGLSKSIKNIGKKFGVQVHCKGGATIKNLLMAPKDKDPIQKQSGVIYKYHCDRVDCDEEYIGESSRTFGERFKEHLKPPSPIYDHSNISGHNVTINNFKIIGREDLNQIRTIKEALYIRVNDPSLNRNVGKYHLPHVWDEVLFNTSELKLN